MLTRVVIRVSLIIGALVLVLLSATALLMARI